VATLYEDYEINQGTDATITHQFREIDGLARDLTGFTPSAKLKINYAQDTGTSFSAIVASPVTNGTVVLFFDKHTNWCSESKIQVCLRYGVVFVGQ